eukprot:scaffold35278_cov54-Attheya_sp.AAC.2
MNAATLSFSSRQHIIYVLYFYDTVPFGRWSLHEFYIVTTLTVEGQFKDVHAVLDHIPSIFGIAFDPEFNVDSTPVTKTARGIGYKFDNDGRTRFCDANHLLDKVGMVLFLGILVEAGQDLLGLVSGVTVGLEFVNAAPDVASL